MEQLDEFLRKNCPQAGILSYEQKVEMIRKISANHANASPPPH
jgi:hypothetical protein